MSVPAQSITKELIVNFISILGFDEQHFWFHQGGGYNACSKFETANVAYILCLSHYFSKCIKNRAHFRGIKTRLSSAHLKHHWRNSAVGCMKHEEDSVCMYCWELWMLPALNAMFCLFSDVNVNVPVLISGTHFTMWVLWIPKHWVWHLIVWYDCIE